MPLNRTLPVTERPIVSNDSESDSASAKLAAAAATALAKQTLSQASKAAGDILTDLEVTLADKPRKRPATGDTLLPAPLQVDEDMFATLTDVEIPDDVDSEDEEAAALRLEQARDELAKMKAALGGAVVAAKRPPPEPRTLAPREAVSPDAKTEVSAVPRTVMPSRTDPLDAAEQALAMAAKARGVTLELPSRVPPDRSDPFSAATQALETARLARGGAPKSEQPSPTPTRSTHVRDPFKAAEEALKRAQAVRAEIGVSPRQEERESAARRELARLRRVDPDTDSLTSDDPPAPKKRNL
jgi:hypothetical protein